MSIYKDVRNVTIAGLVGFAAGVVGGIMLAPKSGKETRQDIAKASARFKEKLYVKYGEAQASLADAIEIAIDKANDFKGSASDGLDKLIDQAKQAEYKAKDVYRAVVHGEADDRHLDKAINQANRAKDNLITYLKK